MIPYTTHFGRPSQTRVLDSRSYFFMTSSIAAWSKASASAGISVFLISSDIRGGSFNL